MKLIVILLFSATFLSSISFSDMVGASEHDPSDGSAKAAIQEVLARGSAWWKKTSIEMTRIKKRWGKKWNKMMAPVSPMQTASSSIVAEVANDAPKLSTLSQKEAATRMGSDDADRKFASLSPASTRRTASSGSSDTKKTGGSGYDATKGTFGSL